MHWFHWWKWNIMLQLFELYLKNGFDVFPGFDVTAGHEWRSITGTFFATWHAWADEEDAFGTQHTASPRSVRILRIPTVNDDVSFFEQRQQLVDKLVNRCASCQQLNSLSFHFGIYARFHFFWTGLRFMQHIIIYLTVLLFGEMGWNLSKSIFFIVF